MQDHSSVSDGLLLPRSSCSRIYALIYLEIFRVRVADLESTEYVLYVFCGLVPYLAAAEAIALGTTP